MLYIKSLYVPLGIRSDKLKTHVLKLFKVNSYEFMNQKYGFLFSSLIESIKMVLVEGLKQGRPGNRIQTYV